jgi:hypothetical protein
MKIEIELRIPRRSEGNEEVFTQMIFESTGGIEMNLKDPDLIVGEMDFSKLSIKLENATLVDVCRIRRVTLGGEGDTKTKVERCPMRIVHNTEPKKEESEKEGD